MPASESPIEALRTRLEAVLSEAREHGVADEIQHIMSSLARERAPGPVEEGPAIPARFGMVGDSPQMHEVFALLERVAPSDVSVLIQGETGTGKELVAKALHGYGPRSGGPFLAENCAAVPENLLESELFGHKKGSFTGAVNDRAGHFVAADGGTVFLDEIGDMPPGMQAKLLRVLQDGEVRPVGANTPSRVDVRVLAATNKDLRAMCGEGTFREDLYFRLNVITIELPPLREREGDAVHLTHFFLKTVCDEMGRPARFTDEALAAMAAWRWPGNVRELENEVRRAVALGGETIDVVDLSPALRDQSAE